MPVVDDINKMCKFVNQLSSMSIFANRLKAARKMKCWSLQELADALEPSISKQAIHKYETGAAMPNDENLIQLAKVLGVNSEYFFRSESVELGEVAFRKKSRLSVKAVNSIKEIVREHLERYLEAEYFLQEMDVFQNPLDNNFVPDNSAVDAMAEEIQDKWNLGSDPIPNVIEMLEEHAVRVIEIDVSEDFNGLSTYVDKIPVIVVNQRFSIENKRFTALHELAHLILNIDKGIDEEKVCHAFAGAMLLPGNTLERILGEKRNNISMGELVSIKEQYGISEQAIIMRAKARNIISELAYKRFWTRLGDNKKEIDLGKYNGDERSFRLERIVFRLVNEEMISLSKAAHLLKMKTTDLRNRLEALPN